ncbi:hypothetical protein AAVH_43075 [Aphelenchoides avenae]|nr:hypothetical protein AAVH_43075 [Aphelenchus avenae]
MTESELHNDPRYQCWCGINAEKAALVIAIIGAILSGLSLAIIPLIAYICIIVAIKTKNPSLYTVFFVMVIFAVAMYVVFIIVLLVAISDGSCRTNATEDGCVFAIVIFAISLAFQIWVIWVVYKAYLYTKAVGELGCAHYCQAQ